MSYEFLQDIIAMPEVTHTVVGTAALGLGYLLGSGLSRNRLNLEAYNRDIVCAQEQTKQAEFLFREKRLQTKESMRRLAYEHAAEDHERTKEREEIAYQRERTHAQERRDHALELASRLLDLKDPLVQYLNELRASIGNHDPAYARARAEYRKTIVEAILKDCEEKDDGLFYKLSTDETDIFDDEMMERIEHVVDARYPLENPESLPELPHQLQSLLERFLTTD